MTLQLQTQGKLNTYRWINKFEDYIEQTAGLHTVPDILVRLFYFTKNTSVKILQNKMIIGTGTHNASTLHLVWLDAVPILGPRELKDTAGLAMLNAPFNAGSHSVLQTQANFTWVKDSEPRFTYRNHLDTNLAFLILSTNTSIRFYFQVIIEIMYVQRTVADRKSEFAHNYFFEESHDYHCDCEEQDLE